MAFLMKEIMANLNDISFSDCDWRSFPHCPKCDKADYDWWETEGGKNAMDGDVWEIHCYDCNINYAVAASVDISFASKEIENE